MKVLNKLREIIFKDVLLDNTDRDKADKLLLEIEARLDLAEEIVEEVKWCIEDSYSVGGSEIIFEMVKEWEEKHGIVRKSVEYWERRYASLRGRKHKRRSRI